MYNFHKRVKGNIEKPYLLRLNGLGDHFETEKDLLKDTVIVNLNGKPRTFMKKALYFIPIDNFLRTFCINLLENR
jgi:hypothetical protein